MRELIDQRNSYRKIVVDKKKDLTDLTDNQMLKDMLFEDCLTNEVKTEVKKQKMNVLILGD